MLRNQQPQLLIQMQERPCKVFHLVLPSHFSSRVGFSGDGLGWQRHRLISGISWSPSLYTNAKGFSPLNCEPSLPAADAWARAQETALKSSAVDVHFSRGISFNQGNLQMPWWRSIWWPCLLGTWQTSWPFASIAHQKTYLEPLTLPNTLQFSCKQF